MFPVDIQLLELVQSLGEGFHIFMKVLTKIGESNNYFLVIVLLMWCFHFRKFSAMAILLPLSGLVTAGLKYGIQMPRPYHIHENTDLIEGYGMPSGHSMSAVVFWGYLSHLLKKTWFTVLSVIMIIGISISRIYRDSHFPSQIIAGFLIAILILWLCIRFQDRIAMFMHKLSLGKAWVISGILPLTFVALTIIMMFTGYDGSGLEDIESVFSSAGLLFGFSIGLYLMNRKGTLESKVSLGKQIVKILIIVISFFLVGFVTGYASKAYDINVWIGSPTVLIVNYFTALWFCYYGPLLLTKFNLFRLIPESTSVVD